MYCTTPKNGKKSKVQSSSYTTWSAKKIVCKVQSSRCLVPKSTFAYSSLARICLLDYVEHRRPTTHHTDTLCVGKVQRSGFTQVHVAFVKSYPQHYTVYSLVVVYSKINASTKKLGLSLSRLLKRNIQISSATCHNFI